MKDILAFVLIVFIGLAIVFGIMFGIDAAYTHSCQQFGVKFSVETVYDSGTCYVKADRLTPVNVYLWQIGALK